MTITEISNGYYKASLRRDNGSTDLFGTDRLQLIMSLVEEAFECDISRRDRSLRTTFGRKAAAYLLRRYTKLNLKEISAYTGTKDHTTAIHNIKQANNLIDTEDWFKDKMKRICQKIEIIEN